MLKITDKIFNELKSKLITDDKFSERQLISSLSEITYEYSRNENGHIDNDRL